MHPVRRQISPHVSRLRRDSTNVEKVLWSILRNRNLAGFKFRRQWTIAPYIVDFACIEAMLIVELDGGQHTPEIDGNRTHFLQDRNYRVVRFWNNEVIENREGVAEAILNALLHHAHDKKKTLTQPSPANAGEG